MNQIIKNNNGIVALLSVVIIGVFALIITKTSANIGRADLDMANDSIEAAIALANAESCLYEALGQVRQNAEFITDGRSLELNDGTCSFSVEKIGETYVIRTEGRIHTYLKKINTEAMFDGENIRLLSYQSY